jgi:hypothetical protein
MGDMAMGECKNKESLALLKHNVNISKDDMED